MVLAEGACGLDDAVAGDEAGDGVLPHGAGGRAEAPLSLVLKGTDFQLRAWEALLRIPSGHAVAYQDLAAMTGSPKASRAVGSALAQNPIACLIPCHRVLQATGALGQYHWGAPRKQAMLGFERARLEGRSA